MSITYNVLPLEEGIEELSTRQVEFTCDESGITIVRTINYTEVEEEWNERLEQQARGVQNKIKLGVITEPTEEVETEVTV
jgi:hypothetical protein